MSEVKHLTKEDIESQGFEFTGRSIDIWFKKEGSFQIGSWTSYKITLHYGTYDNRLFVYADDTGEETPIFQGEIKTLDEFKTLMKWLKIN